MRRLAAVLLCLLMAAGRALGGPPSVAPSDDGARVTRAGVAWGEPADGLRSRIWLAAGGTVVRDRRPIVIRYEIENVGTETKIVMHRGFWSNHRIDVAGADGRPVALTAAGQRMRNLFDRHGPQEKTVPVPLRPGERDSAWLEIDLRPLFAFEAEGGHTVTVTYHEGGTVVVSNALPFILRP